MASAGKQVARRSGSAGAAWGAAIVSVIANKALGIGMAAGLVGAHAARIGANAGPDDPTPYVQQVDRATMYVPLSMLSAGLFGFIAGYLLSRKMNGFVAFVLGAIIGVIAAAAAGYCASSGILPGS